MVSMTTTIEPLTSLEDAASEWRELGARSGNPFLSWEWSSTWWRHFARDRRLRAAVCRRDGRAVAILPLYEAASRPVRVLRLIGHGAGDHLGLVCAPHDAPEASAALRRWLERFGWGVLLAERLPVGDTEGASFGGTRLLGESSPVARLEGGWDAYLARRSAHLRKRIRYAERRLSRDHRVRFRLTEDPLRLAEDFDVLERLHTQRWGAAGTGALSGARGAFHREFAARALEAGTLRLWLLELDGRPAAAWYGFRLGGAEWFHQSGRDPALERSSVGFVLLAHTLRAAAQDGQREYCFLRGREEYKGRFADTEAGIETRVLARGLAGRVAARAAGSLLRTPPSEQAAGARFASRTAARLAGQA